MKNTIFDDFFDFEVHFKEFVLRTNYFRKVNKAMFFIFDDVYKSINYVYAHNTNEVLTTEQIKDLIKKSKTISENMYCEVKLLKDNFENCSDNRFW